MHDSEDSLAGTLRGAFSGSFLSRIAFGLLLAYLLAAPFPYGSVMPSVTGNPKILLGAFLIGLLTFLSPDGQLHVHGLRRLSFAFLIIPLVGLIQLLPLPLSVLKWLAPPSYEAWSGVREVFELYGRTPPAARISLAPWETAGVTLLALALIVLFLSAAALLHTRERRRIFAATIVLAGLIQVAVAFLEKDTLSRLRGSFINPNHLAGYLFFSFAFALGFIWHQARREVGEFLSHEFAEQRVRHLERALPKTALAIVLWGVLATGIFMSQSRGGIIAAVGGTLLLAALALQHRRSSKKTVSQLGISLALFVFLGTAFAVSNSGSLPFLRFLPQGEGDLTDDYRVQIWRASVQAFRLSPVFGSGLGCFREICRRVQPASVDGLVEQAHQDYLQILVTGGALGFLAAIAALLLGLSSLVGGFYRQLHREESAFALAGIGGLVFLLLHANTEFNFSVPATTATLAACLGSAWAAVSWHRPKPEIEPVAVTPSEQDEDEEE